MFLSYISVSVSPFFSLSKSYEKMHHFTYSLKGYNYFHFTDQKNESCRLNSVSRTDLSDSRALKISLCKPETLLSLQKWFCKLPMVGNGGCPCLCVSTQSLPSASSL